VGTRVVGIDLGKRRIGVSVSDSQRVLATPYSVITRSGDTSADRRAIAALVSEFGAGLVVVGLPLTLAEIGAPLHRQLSRRPQLSKRSSMFRLSCTMNA